MWPSFYKVKKALKSLPFIQGHSSADQSDFFGKKIYYNLSDILKKHGIALLVTNSLTTKSLEAGSL